MNRPLTREHLWLATLALASLYLCVAMPVFSQEAYYWTYAQHPDLSYYDHPPMVAWGIWLGTRLFGATALGIRASTWLFGVGAVVLGARLLRRFGVDVTGRVAWLQLSLGVPTLMGLRFLANPDPPLVFFTLLTVFLLWRARDGGIGWWLGAGLAAGLALTSKYTAAFLLPGGVIALLLDPRLRMQLRRPGPWLAVAVAALAFAPVVVWNAGNDFASFRFQTGGRWAHASFGGHWLAEALGGQLLVVGPVVAALLPVCCLWLWRRLRALDPRALWVLAFALPMPLWLLVNALWIQVKINWFAPSVALLLLGGIVWWRESGFVERHPKWAKATRLSVALLAVAALLGPLVRLFPAHRGSSWTGWDRIAARAEHWEDVVDDADGIEGNFFFFGADYRDSAQLGLALHQLVRHDDGPLEPTLSCNVLGLPALQFDHWDPPAGRIGQDAVFVLYRSEQRKTLVDQVRARFDAIELAERVEVRRFGVRLADAAIYVCRGYHGPAG